MLKILLHEEKKKSNRDFSESFLCIVKAQHIINRRLFFSVSLFPFAFLCFRRTLVQASFIYRVISFHLLINGSFVHPNPHLHVIPFLLNYIHFLSMHFSWLRARRRKDVCYHNDIIITLVAYRKFIRSRR